MQHLLPAIEHQAIFGARRPRTWRAASQIRHVTTSSSLSTMTIALRETIRGVLEDDGRLQFEDFANRGRLPGGLSPGINRAVWWSMPICPA